MESNQYPAESRFKVYIVLGSNSMGKYTYSLASATAEEFPSRDEAYRWIEEEGARQTDYLIIELFRKK